MVQTANTALTQASNTVPFPKAAVAACVDAGIKLEPEAQEDARYYGLGQIGRYFGLELSDPSVQQNAVSKIGNILVTKWRQGSMHPKGLTFNDLHAGLSLVPLLGPFKEIALHAADRMPRPERLAIDSLSTIAKSRKHNGPDSTEALSTKQKNRLVTDARKGVDGANRLAEEAMGGTGQVLAVVLNGLRERAQQTEGRAITSSDALTDLIDPQTLSGLEILRVSIPSANLRLDELRYDLGSYIVIDRSGKPVFVTGNVPKESDLPDPAPRLAEDGLVLLHTKREKCPAVFVRGLISLVGRIVLDSISVAESTIARR